MKAIRIITLTFISLFSVLASSAQQFNCYVANDTLISPTVYQFDIYLEATTSDFYLRNIFFGFQFNPTFIPIGSTITASSVPGNAEIINYNPSSYMWNASASCLSIGSFTVSPCVSSPNPVDYNLMMVGVPRRISTFRLISDIPFNCATPNISIIRQIDQLPAPGVVKLTVTSWSNTCTPMSISVNATCTHFDSNTLYDKVNNLQINIQKNSPDSIFFCNGIGRDSFSVNVTSNGSLLPINYQWYLNGIPLRDDVVFQGATTKTLVVTNPTGFNIYNELVCKAWQCSPAMSVQTSPFILGVPISNDNIAFTEDACDSRNGASHQPVFHVKAYLQGYYSANGFMNNSGKGGTLYISGKSIDPADADSLVLQLRDPVSKALIATSSGILKTDGNTRFEFQTNYLGNCYLCIRHRNAIETWSSTIISLANQNSYDFTDSPTKTFGSNAVQTDDASYWAIYSGDVTNVRNERGMQDGLISQEDFNLVENKVNAIALGYLVEDLTGDLVVEAMDYLIIDNNRNMMIMTMHP